MADVEAAAAAPEGGAAPEQGQSPDSQGSEPSLLGGEDNGDSQQASDQGQDDQGSEGAGNGGDDGAGKDDAVAEGAPDAYSDFTLPEGISADAAALDTATPLFKELNLSQEQSQKLVDFYADRMTQTAEGQTKAFADVTASWATDAKNDPDIGGDNFDANIKTAMAGITAFGTPELTELLNTTGVGNHPAMIKFAQQVGKLVKEDNPGHTQSGGKSEASQADRLYPKQ